MLHCTYRHFGLLPVLETGRKASARGLYRVYHVCVNGIWAAFKYKGSRHDTKWCRLPPPPVLYANGGYLSVELFEAFPQAQPAGQGHAVLSPGKDPGDGSQGLHPSPLLAPVATGHSPSALGHSMKKRTSRTPGGVWQQCTGTPTREKHKIIVFENKLPKGSTLAFLLG